MFMNTPSTTPDIREIFLSENAQVNALIQVDLAACGVITDAVRQKVKRFQTSFGCLPSSVTPQICEEIINDDGTVLSVRSMSPRRDDCTHSDTLLGDDGERWDRQELLYDK